MWDSAQWTAIGTTVLAVVTLVYVVIAGFLLQKSARSAKAAESAAESAEEALALQAMPMVIPIVWGHRGHRGIHTYCRTAAP